METLLTKWRYGQIHVISKDDIISNSLLLYGEWAQNEVELIEFLCTRIDNPTIIIGGSNIGVQTIALSKLDKKNIIHSFEIHPQIFQVLRENIELNNCKNVQLYNTGLSDREDKLRVPSLDKNITDNIGSFSLHTKYNRPDLDAELMTIDQLNLTSCSLIHLDIEKHELTCIKGALETIKKFKPDIYAEVLTPKYCKAIYKTLKEYYKYIYLHLPQAYNVSNFNNESFNIFKQNRETSILLTNKSVANRDSLFLINSNSGIDKLYKVFQSQIPAIQTKSININSEYSAFTSSESYVIQVYVDSGNGFDEEHSYIYRTNSKYNTINIDVSIYSNIYNLRVDPHHGNCIVKIHNVAILCGGQLIELEIAKTEHLAFRTNSYYLFDNNDPQIIFQELDQFEHISDVILELEYFDLNIDLIKILFGDVLSESERLETIIESYADDEDNKIILTHVHDLLETIHNKNDQIHSDIAEGISNLQTETKALRNNFNKYNSINKRTNKRTNYEIDILKNSIETKYESIDKSTLYNRSQIENIDHKINLISTKLDLMSQKSKPNGAIAKIRTMFNRFVKYILLLIGFFFNPRLIKEIVLGGGELLKKSNWERLIIAIRHEPIRNIIGNATSYLKNKRAPFNEIIKDPKNGKIAFNFERVELTSENYLLLNGWLITEKPFEKVIISIDSLNLKKEISFEYDRYDVVEAYSFSHRGLQVGFSHKIELSASSNELTLHIIFGKSQIFTQRLAINESSHSTISINQINSIFNGGGKQYALVALKHIYIIVPIYNAFELLKDCLNSIFKHTTGSYTLILINDCSTDLRIASLLDETSANHDNCLIINNEVNLGFIKSVNKAYTKVKGHFIILNSDTVVTPNWVHKLIYPIVKENFASSTPISNAATIFSFPIQDEDNTLYLDFQPDEINKVAELIDPDMYIPIPTGVGFAMAFNFNVTKEIGLFDTIYGQGYAEENDWCMRATAAGYKHALVPNCFIYHKHGGSFQTSTKKTQIKKNLVILNKRFSNYDTLINQWMLQNPLRPYFLALKILLQSEKAQKTNLVIDYTRGGGAAIYRNNYIDKLKKKEDHFNIFIDGSDSMNQYSINFYFNDRINGFKFSQISELMPLFSHFNIDFILINNLVGSRNIFKWKNFIQFLKKEQKTQIEFLIHDFHAICPSYNLLNSDSSFCGIPEDISVCNQCLPKINHTNLFGYENILKWRDYFDSLLLLCDKVTCFSRDSKNHVLKAYPGLKNKIKVRPHQVDYIGKKVAQVPSDHLVIGVLGGINLQKGSAQVLGLAEYINDNRLPIDIVVIGQLVTNSSKIKYNSLVVTGPYKQTDIIRLTEEYNITTFLIPSIWPETFSYTTEEIMLMDMPIAVFDIGAPYERVKEYEKGIILKYEDKDNPGELISQMTQSKVISLKSNLKSPSEINREGL